MTARLFRAIRAWRRDRAYRRACQLAAADCYIQATRLEIARDGRTVTSGAQIDLDYLEMQDPEEYLKRVGGRP
jgi:hypothetical protein